jgi:hypothetical protein
LLRVEGWRRAGGDEDSRKGEREEGRGDLRKG